MFLLLLHLQLLSVLDLISNVFVGKVMKGFPSGHLNLWFTVNVYCMCPSLYFKTMLFGGRFLYLLILLFCYKHRAAGHFLSCKHKIKSSLKKKAKNSKLLIRLEAICGSLGLTLALSFLSHHSQQDTNFRFVLWYRNSLCYKSAYARLCLLPSLCDGHFNHFNFDFL